MANKLISLKIDHIAGVDRPANKRRFLVIKQEKSTSDPIEKTVYIESSDRYRVCEEEEGKFCVYDIGGNNTRKLGEYETQKEAIASIAKSEIAKAMSVEKEGDKYCLYDGEKKIGSFDSMAEAKEKMKSLMMKGATMLKKEQIAKISDKEVQEAVVTQQEEMVALEKKNKELEDKLLKAGDQPPKDDNDEEIWKGVPPAIRNRFEGIKKERDDMAKKAKDEKDQHENAVWINKSRDFKYIQIVPEHFGKVLKSVAEHCTNGEADEIFRVLNAADTIIGKGAIFSELGKSNNGNGHVYDATNITARVDALADDYMVVDKTLKKDKAIEKVFKENPDWYPLYNRENQVRV